MGKLVGGAACRRAAVRRLVGGASAGVAGAVRAGRTAGSGSASICSRPGAGLVRVSVARGVAAVAVFAGAGKVLVGVWRVGIGLIAAGIAVGGIVAFGQVLLTAGLIAAVVVIRCGWRVRLIAGRIVAGGVVASWAVVFACLVVALLYIRLVAGVTLGGREGLAAAACAVCALASCSIGTVIGAIPRVSTGAKDVALTILTMGMSLPAGLFGTPSQQLADWLDAHVPAVQLINPAVQVGEAFYRLTFYDSLLPFGATIAVLIAISVILFGIAAVFMRRQRYAAL